MLMIFYNNWRRLLEEKNYLIVAITLTVFAVIVAIVLTNKAEIKGNIAVVSISDGVPLKDSKYFNVTKLNSKPLKSELIQNRYDAIVTVKDGLYTIDTIKNDEFKLMIHRALKHPDTFVPDMDVSRKVGTNIIGYITMFLLMQGCLYSRLFCEDKVNRVIERVSISPINFMKYLFGHAVFIFTLISIPTFIVIVIATAKLVGISVGFSLMQYSGLILILSVLSTSFGLFINSLFCHVDTANMVGSSIIVLSSILSGGFSPLSKEETLFTKSLNVLPQKNFINFVDALEKGVVTTNIGLQLMYVIVLSSILFALAIIKTRKDYISIDYSSLRFHIK